MSNPSSPTRAEVDLLEVGPACRFVLGRLGEDEFVGRHGPIQGASRVPLPSARALHVHGQEPCRYFGAADPSASSSTGDPPYVLEGLPRFWRDEGSGLDIEAARQLGVDIADAVVVGDSVWDLLAARRARALGVGLLSGGYGADELERAGAYYRVYEDPRDFLRHLDEIGVRALEA